MQKVKRFLSIAQKECNETAHWLQLLHATEYLPEKECKGVYDEVIELLKMVRSTTITTKDKYNS